MSLPCVACWARRHWRQCVTHDAVYDAELEVKDTEEVEQKKWLTKKASRRLRMLFADFEAQIKWQDEVDEERAIPKKKSP